MRMNFRDRFKRNAIKTRHHLPGTSFEKRKIKCHREIKSAKKTSYKIALNSCAKDQRKTWKTINEPTSRKSNKTVINEKNIYQGQKSKSQVDVAELLNNFDLTLAEMLRMLRPDL